MLPPAPTSLAAVMCGCAAFFFLAGMFFLQGFTDPVGWLPFAALGTAFLLVGLWAKRVFPT